MRLLVSGDWHLTDNKPKNRVDDYLEAQENKINQIYKIALQNSVDFIIQPGDLCDSHDAPDKFKTRWITIFKSFPKIITVAGQHDLRYHTSNIMNTPFGVLKEALNFIMVNDSPFEIAGVHIYGAPWGKAVPAIKDMSVYNILVTHRLITEGEMWPGQEKYEVAGTFLRRYKFNLVVSGDNHKSIHYGYKSHMLINCGSLMRNRIDQSGHKPCVWIADLSNITFRQIFLKVKNFDSVFNLEKAEDENIKCERLKKLAETLKSGSKFKGLDYKKRVMAEVAKLKSLGKLTSTTEKIIEEVMDG